MRILVVLSILVMCGCTKAPEPICKTVFKTTTAAANIIATTLQCNNAPAISADLSGQITKLGLCAETTRQSTLSDLICPTLSNFVSTTALSSIPSEWECSVTRISDLFKTKIHDTCVKIIK